VDPRVGLDHLEKRKFLTLAGLELQLLGRPARAQSLYRLRYPGSSLYRSIPKLPLVLILSLQLSGHLSVPKILSEQAYYLKI
jgi:hypothetical protein